MQKKEIQCTLRCGWYWALIGPVQATGFAGGLDLIQKLQSDKLLFTRAHPKNAVIASQCAHWRGNPPDFPRTQKNEGIVYRSSLKSWGIATPGFGLVRNDSPFLVL